MGCQGSNLSCHVMSAACRENALCIVLSLWPYLVTLLMLQSVFNFMFQEQSGNGFMCLPLQPTTCLCCSVEIKSELTFESIGQLYCIIEPLVQWGWN